MNKNKCEKIWKNCLEVIKDNINSQSFKTWFEPIKAISLKNNTLTIQVPSQFFYEWLEEHYIMLLKKTIKNELGETGDLEYSIVMENTGDNKSSYNITIPTTNRNATKNHPVSLSINTNHQKIKNPFIVPGLKKVNIDSQLNENYSFNSFVEGECNRLAKSAGYAAAKKPGETSFNPFLIYGKVGLGKTHLSQAIGLEIKKLHPNKIVLYISSDKFTQQFISAAANNTYSDFVHFYQLIDVLIVDDIQFLSGKEKTQEVFFHIFNHLHQTNKQIIMTSDRPPIDIQGIEQRLLSRFKWGLSADLQIPSLETRIAILKKKIYSEGIELPYDVVEYLAYSINTNIRELEGALISIIAQASLNKKQITMELAKNMIDKFVKNTSREVSIEYIQKIVCDYFNLSVDIIKTKTRKREIVQARQISMYFAKRLTKSSLATIGAKCGGKDHATVLHAYKTINNLIDTDKTFKSYVKDLEKEIG